MLSQGIPVMLKGRLPTDVPPRFGGLHPPSVTVPVNLAGHLPSICRPSLPTLMERSGFWRS